MTTPGLEPHVVSFLAVLLTGAFALAIAGVWLMIKAGLTDTPIEARKAGMMKRPTGGGLVLLPLIVCGGVALAGSGLGGLPVWHAGLHTELWRLPMLAVLAAMLAMAAVGLADDLTELSPLFRLGCQLAVGLALAVTMRVESLPLPGGSALQLGPVVGTIGTAAWVVVCINAVNFVDGANGVASGTVCAAMLGLTSLAVAAGHVLPALFCLLVGVCLLGFMVWNWGRGLIFLGNVGALMLGTAFAGAALMLAGAPPTGHGLIASVGPFAVALCLFPVLADVLLTLLWRAGRRRKLTEGHREHVYQLAIKAGLNHTQVAGLFVFLTLKSALLAFAASLFGPGTALLVLPVLILAYVRLDARVRRAALESGHLDP